MCWTLLLPEKNPVFRCKFPSRFFHIRNFFEDGKIMESGNTSNGTVTDLDGYYSISLPEDGTIVFTCLGFEEVQEPVSKRNTINVSMAEEKLSIDAAEVVSIGYGTVSRRDLTGSVSKVDMGEVMKSNVTNFDQALTGRVAGVVVSTSDGALGEEANITIRGNNSLTQSSAPLYIIDGFPSESSMATSLNSADIESIDILKDAWRQRYTVPGEPTESPLPMHSSPLPRPGG